MNKKIYFCLSLFILSTALASAQNQVDVLEQRVQGLEAYIQTLQPMFAEFSKSVEKGLTEYTTNLEKGLETYSANLESRVDERLRMNQGQAAVLDPLNPAFQKIETNVSDFLISIERTEITNDGVRLFLNIGNPNYASYNGFRLKIMWGDKFPSNAAISYENWRKTLVGAEYSFEGRLEKGLWTPVQVDLSPAIAALTNMYIECEMEVLSVELQSSK